MQCRMAKRIEPDLLGEPAGEEGVEILGVEPHESFQVLPLDNLSLILLFCQLR